MYMLLAGVLIVMVLVCGCGQKGQDGGEATPLQTTGAAEDATGQTTQGDGDPPVIEGISQEDLDALGEDLEALEFEDLGGLPDR